MSRLVRCGSAVAVVGPRHEPVDGVRDFCENLAGSIAPLGVALKIVAVTWDRAGWLTALRDVAKQSRLWAHQSVLAQYTHTMWPWRGFPLGFIQLVSMLQRSGCRVVVVIHDPSPFPGVRPRDRARRLVQIWVMRQAVRIADGAVSTVAVERIEWMRGSQFQEKIRSIPVGSNIPVSPRGSPDLVQNWARTRNVVVFGVTADRSISAEVTLREVNDVCAAMRAAAHAVSGLHLTVVGRGSEEAGPLFQAALRDSPVGLSVLGLVPSEKLAAVLNRAEIMLFARGHVSTRRTTAIAGMGYGVPLVGYSGEETDDRLMDAGTLLVPLGDREALAKALVQLLSDDELREQLCQQGLAAYSRYFAWEVIAQRYLEMLSFV